MLLFMAGTGYNALERAASAPSPESSNSKFPPANLCDGNVNKPWIAGSAGGSGYVDFDLQTVPNGAFEAAFVGGLPAAGWTKNGTTTVTRDVAVFNEGIASAKLESSDASGSGDAIRYDLSVRPGEVLNIAGQVRSGAGGTTAGLRVRNLTTGNYLTSAGAWQAAVANAAVSTSTTWGTFSSPVTIESYVACGSLDRVTLRIEAGFYSTPLEDIYVDGVIVFPRITFASIHGHNIPTGSAPVELYSGSSSPASNLSGTFTLGTPTTFMALSATDRRYWRLQLGADPLEDAIWIGELVLGQYATLTRSQNLGQGEARDDPQDRSDNGLGPLQAFVRTLGARRSLTLQFRLTSAGDFSEWQEIMARSRNGAYPLLVVPDSSDAGSAMICRTDSRWSNTRPVGVMRDHSIELQEMSLPVVVA